VIGGSVGAPRPAPRAGAPPAAELTGRREVVPGLSLVELRAPALAAGARAGQAVHLRIPGEDRAILRRSALLASADPGTGTISVHVRAEDPGAPAISRLDPGAPVDVFGPYGRPFEIDPRSRHLLLIAEGRSAGALRFLADEAIRDGRQVVLLASAETARDVYPTRLLPDEVELVVATRDGSLGRPATLVEVLPELEGWADQAFAAAPTPTLAELARLAATRRQRLGVAQLGRKRGGGRPPAAGSAAARRRAWLQVVLELPLACALGVCLGCAAPGAAGTSPRICREGPAFAADELDWESEARW
jgi:dihydroorotate dehydrogenase electron transfer subunit